MINLKVEDKIQAIHDLSPLLTKNKIYKLRNVTQFCYYIEICDDGQRNVPGSKDCFLEHFKIYYGELNKNIIIL
jgi:hypothetical protein